jgi:hypothetical protein
MTAEGWKTVAAVAGPCISIVALVVLVPTFG